MSSHPTQSTLRIGIREERTQFRPGEEITGAVLWELEQAPKLVELRLIWFTRGKGTGDSEIIGTQQFTEPQAGDTRPFTMRLPEAPYSFSGKLISLIWALELVAEPGTAFVRVEIQMSPNGTEIILPG